MPQPDSFDLEVAFSGRERDGPANAIVRLVKESSRGPAAVATEPPNPCADHVDFEPSNVRMVGRAADQPI